jgi:hypothetical protein
MENPLTYIYIVEARGSGYYDKLEFYSAHANEADARLRADQILKAYEEVTVTKVTLQ